MAQPSVAAFFNTRKRSMANDGPQNKSRKLVDIPETISQENVLTPQKADDVGSLKATSSEQQTRYGRTIKRIASQSDVVPKKVVRAEKTKQQKLVPFIKKGPLTPKKTRTDLEVSAQNELQKVNEETPMNKDTVLKDNITNMDHGFKTPTKQIIRSSSPLKHDKLKSLVKKELKFDEVKMKVSRSAKLQELKASLGRLQELEKTRKAQEERNRLLREGGSAQAKKSPGVQLKEFKTIELEVLTSPSKTFKTPTKLPPKTPDKNELMSPRRTEVSKRMLFSPSKDGSPAKLVVPPAYQRFMSLAETSNKAGQLPLPFKYRHLIEIFKGVDAMCAMFHNRKECITFKKLKPAVQRMLRKNFNEDHLAQIKHLFPEAFIFAQMKMRNYGSTSKADYFQLVITPNVENAPEKQKMCKIDEDNVLASAQSSSMNPHVMTERLQHFQNILLERVKEEHDKFLKSLNPPLVVPKSQVTRWHPDFDLENCADIEKAHLPQPPNVEKYSSARDILSTARNLFNCATPMERAIERYEAKLQADKVAAELFPTIKTSSNLDETPVVSEVSVAPPPTQAPATVTPDATSALLKGVPKALLEKIRAKQAAKALESMTRRPSQEQEAIKYSRLPELARHVRNVFITERKGVLTLETVIKKIQNSFRAYLTPPEIEGHLRMIAKEVPTWLSFHEVRKTMYVKVAKDMDLSKVLKRLEGVANEKSK